VRRNVSNLSSQGTGKDSVVGGVRGVATTRAEFGASCHVTVDDTI